MSNRTQQGEIFDPRTVEQRFDLQGNAKIAIPAILDLDRHQLLWADVNLPPTLRFHSAAGYRATLAHLGHDLQAHFGAGARPSQWDVAVIDAAARARRVVVNRRDGSVDSYTAEPTPAFIARL